MNRGGGQGPAAIFISSSFHPTLPSLFFCFFFSLSLSLLLSLTFSLSFSFSFGLSFLPLFSFCHYRIRSLFLLSFPLFPSSLCIVLLTEKGKREKREGKRRERKSGRKINVKSKVRSGKEKRKRDVAEVEREEER